MIDPEIIEYIRNALAHTHNGVDSPFINKTANGISGSSTYGRMYINAGQNILTGTATKVLLDTTSESTGLTADTSNHRLTATKAGYYYVSGQVYYQSFVTGHTLTAWIYVNGVQTTYTLLGTGLSGNLAGQSVADIVHLNVGDYVELYTFHSFGSTAALQTGSLYTYLNIFKL